MIGVYRFGALGDVSASLPVLKAFKEEVKFIGSRTACELVASEGFEVEILTDRSLPTLIKTALKRRREGIKELVDLQNNDRSKLFRLFFTSYTNKGVSKEQPVTKIFYHIAKKSGKVKKLDTSFTPKSKTYIVLNTGSSPKWLSKRLPQHKWIEFSKVLYERFELPFLLTGDESEREYIQHLAKELYGKVEVVAGKTSIVELKEILREAFLCVSTDSAPMHLSAVQKTPTIGLFGATNWIISAPFGDWSVALYDKNLFSSPPKQNRIEIGNYYEGIRIEEGLERLRDYLKVGES